ncbi:winged helix DNA-binding domain-containing protein [Glycomyces arizonensis]|uniref:winged helix DNA-binding domain-containing protein n=1 Tax=Glycomyces arizonensis TaxID=256035 RepID=UPI000404465E|nr:winged helix DNA-binding domain-containing protein [Glycomyces arizonensis]
MIDSRGTIDHRRILHFRMNAQQLTRDKGSVEDTAVLDFGVQDTGTDGARWALALRGADVADEDALVLLWTVRGAPHLYRRGDTGRVAAAVEPYSEADAAKRVFDASKPLKAAGIGVVEALDEVASRMRSIVTEPMVKGELSGRLSAELPDPYLRFCRPCDATHIYELPFRLAALRAGLELEPGTSPPVLRPIPGFAAAAAEERFDLVRSYLRLLGPATPKHVAEFLDSPVKEVKAHWPEDAVEVSVDGEVRWLLAEDEAALRSAEAEGTRLLGPYDLFLQARDRATLVPDKARAKELWPVLGRPGAVLVDGEIAGVWRPRKSGKRFNVAVRPWGAMSAAVREAVAAQAERLAAHRGIALTGVDFESD